MTTRAIIFDYGDVLDALDDPQPWTSNLESLAAELGMSRPALWNLFYTTDPWQKVKRGQITVPEYLDALLTPLGVIGEAAHRNVAARLAAGHESVHADMDALLRELKPRYKLAILSNTHEREMETWLAEVQGLAGIFDVVVSSAKVGLAKPEPEIYQLALELLQVQPEEVIFIDDKPRNTIAAEALGIPAIVFKSPAQLRHELQSRGILPVEGKVGHAAAGDHRD